MRITPLDIRQKTFEKNFRGYEKDEVNAFLLSLSQEWERIVDENKELRIKLESTEREVTKLPHIPAGTRQRPTEKPGVVGAGTMGFPN